MYVIKLNNLQFHSHLGNYSQEKDIGQNLQIDLFLTLKVDPAKINDQLKNTVSYGKIYKLTAQIVKTNRVNLVETLASNLGRQIKKSDSRILRVRINIRKLALPIEGILDNAEIEMEF